MASPITIRKLRAFIAYNTGLARWLFIHIPKNAGSTMNRHRELYYRMVKVHPMFLASADYRNELDRIMNRDDEHPGYNHARWRDVREDVRRNLQAVAVVRNPWARVVSRYRFALTAMESGRAPADYVPDSFEAFLEERHVYGNRPFYWHRAIRGWYPQADYVTDEAGNLRAHILRQERLSDEATRYFNLKTPLRRRNVSRAGGEKHWKDYYTPKTIQIVADWYAKDIEMFGFDFDAPARRNCHFPLTEE